MILDVGDCLEIMSKMAPASVDSLVTDPPAGISFMNKSWDDDKGGRDAWIAWMSAVMKECLRVMKPGAHGFVWALPRTSHWTATACENAGFEVRDVVTHLFGSGFPKSHSISKAIDKIYGGQREIVGTYKITGHGKTNVEQGSQNRHKFTFNKYSADPVTDLAKQWNGWGTALKPASEHWILVRKPCSEKTVAANVIKHGCGGINIDASRIGNDIISTHGGGDKMARMKTGQSCGPGEYQQHQGRFPANLILDEEAGAMLDEQSGFTKTVPHRTKPSGTDGGNKITLNSYKMHTDNFMSHKDSGGASRFFYCSKTSKAERGEGNRHPTVKSQKLMRYLIRMITPPNGTVLDPFMGSGSTGIAAKTLGFGFIGVEKEKEYFDIARERISKAIVGMNMAQSNKGSFV